MNKLNKYNSYGEISDLSTHIIYIDIMNLSTKHWLRLFTQHIIYFFGSPSEDEFYKFIVWLSTYIKAPVIIHTEAEPSPP